MLRPITPLLTVFVFLAAATLISAQDAPQPEELFDTLDANSDGTLSDDEIGESQRRAYERLLRVGDADGDGSLTRQEYLKAFQPDPPVGAGSPGREGRFARDGRSERPDFGRLFQLSDRDRDGKVALEELPEPLRERMQPLFERLGKEQLTREDFERLDRLRPGQRPADRPSTDTGGLFDRLDKDGSEGISREDLPEPLRRRFDPIFERLGKTEFSRFDFERVMRQLRSDGEGENVQPAESTRRPEVGQPMSVLIALLDADGDGQLTMAEVESLSANFVKLDTNSDGKLSGAELIGFAERIPPRQ